MELARRQRKRCEESLAAFVREGWHVTDPSTPLEWNWHHEALCQHFQVLVEDWMRVQLARMEDWTPEMRRRAAALGVPSPGAAVRQRMQNLLINVPPGTAKSRIISVFGPAWVWLRWPEWSALCLSSNPRTAMRDASKSRELLTSDWYQQTFEPEWGFSEDTDGKSLFKNTRGGFRQSQGITANVTGDRTDAIIVDDPHDAQEVKSDAERENVLDKWDSAIGNRLNDLRCSARLIIMQRLAERDLAGHWLAKGGVEHLCIPLEHEGKPVCKCDSCARGETVLGWRDPRTTVGEVIHKSRFPPDVVTFEKKRLGSYGAAGQLQQRPAPEGGGMFPRSWWRFHSVGGVTPERNGAPVARPEGCNNLPPVPTPQRFDRVLLSLDANFSDDPESSDPAVLHAYGVVGAKRYRLAREAAHGFPATSAMVKRVRDAIRQHSGRVDGVLVENKANGPTIIQTMRNDIPGIVPCEPQGDKKARAAAMQPSVEAGDWYLLDGAEDNEPAVEQFANFPRAAHDDDVDAASQLHAYLAKPAVIIL